MASCHVGNRLTSLLIGACLSFTSASIGPLTSGLSISQEQASSLLETVIKPASRPDLPVIRLASVGQYDCCSKFSTSARGLINTWELFLEFVNGIRGGLMINGSPHAVELTLVPDFSNNTLLKIKLKELVGRGFKLFLGPYGTGASTAAADVINASYPDAFMQLPVTSKLAVFQGKPHVWSALGNGRNYFKPAIEAVGTKLATMGLPKEAAIFEEKHPVVGSWAAGARAWLQENNFIILEDSAVPKAAGASSMADIIFNWTHRFSANGSRPLVIGVTYTQETCMSFLEIAKQQGLQDHVGAFFFSKCADDGIPGFYDRLGHAAHYVGSVGFWSDALRVPDFFTGTHAGDFADTYRKKYSGLEPSYQGVAGWGSIASLCWAVEQAGSADPSAVAAQFARLQRGESLKTIYGEMFFDENGLNRAEPLVSQVIGDARETTLIDEAGRLIYPHPVCPPAEQVDFSSHGCKPASCPDGTEWISTLALCVACRAGSKRSANDTQCVLCNKGTFGSSEAQTACQVCDLGSFAAEKGSTECISCPSGSVAPSVARAECERCNASYFQPLEGQSVCLPCENVISGSTTKFLGAQLATECVCPSALYLNSASVQCTPCGEGLECPIGTSVAVNGTLPQVKPGYWTDPTAPLSVFKCMSEDICPGGPPGSCSSPEMVGRVCAVCADKFRRAGSSCLECTSLETSMVLFPLLPILLGPCLIWFAYSRMRDDVDKYNSWRNGIAVLALLMLNHYQVVALISDTSLELSIPVRDMWSVWSYSNDFVSILSPGCVMSNFQQNFYVAAMAPLIVLGVFLEAYLVQQPLRFVAPHLIMDPSRLFNVYGGLLYAFYTAVVRNSMDLFVCTGHPNGEYTVTTAPQVLCNSPKWNEMVGVAITAVVIFCGMSTAVFLRALWIAPVAFHNPVFRRRWKFLFMKYRPSTWWWAMIWLAKGILSTCALLFRSAFLQIVGLFFVLTLYFALTSSYQPWRHSSGNLFDRLMCMSTLSLTFLALCNSSFSTEQDETQWLVIMFSFLPCLVLPFQVSGLVAKGSQAMQLGITLRNQVTAQHVQRSFCALNKAPLEDVTAFVGRLTSYDRRALLAAADAVLAEHLGEQPRSSRTSQRLVEKEGEHRTSTSDELKLDAALPPTPLVAMLGRSFGCLPAANEEAKAFLDPSKAFLDPSKDIKAQKLSKKVTQLLESEQPLSLDITPCKEEQVRSAEMKKKEEHVVDDKEAITALQEQVNLLANECDLLRQQNGAIAHGAGNHSLTPVTTTLRSARSGNSQYIKRLVVDTADVADLPNFQA